MLTQVVADVCDTFLRVTGLPEHVMQPAFGMAEVCTCMTYNNIYSAGSNLRVTKASLQVNELLLTVRKMRGAAPGAQLHLPLAESGTQTARRTHLAQLPADRHYSYGDYGSQAKKLRS